MKPWHLTIVGFLLFGIGALVARKAKASTAPASPFSDAELGTLPNVPGLLALEKKEPGFIRGFLTVMKQTGADPDKMAAIVAEETMFTPSAGYGGGKRATGLLGWMPASYTKTITGFDVHQIHAMSGIEQLQVIKTTIEKAPGYKTDPPMQGWGSHINAPDDTVIATKGDPKTGVTYDANAPAYDKEKKGYITSGDVRRRVYSMLDMAQGQRVGPDGRII